MSEIFNAESYFALVSRTVEKLPFEAIDRLSNALIEAYENERTIYIFGNGGSASLASHIACDLGKGTVSGSRKRFRVMSLTSNLPLITAWANDSSYADVFAEQLTNFVQPGDIALAISCSGNSLNVLNALRVARSAKAVTLGLTGFNGGKMKALCDICVTVPVDNMQLIEDMHVCISHAVFTCVRHKITSRSSAAAFA